MKIENKLLKLFQFIKILLFKYLFNIKENQNINLIIYYSMIIRRLAIRNFCSLSTPSQPDYNSTRNVEAFQKYY